MTEKYPGERPLITAWSEAVLEELNNEDDDLNAGEETIKRYNLEVRLLIDLLRDEAATWRTEELESREIRSRNYQTIESLGLEIAALKEANARLTARLANISAGALLPWSERTDLPELVPVQITVSVEEIAAPEAVIPGKEEPAVAPESAPQTALQPAEGKRCSVCKETKPYSEFPRSSATKDGYHFRCSPCSSDHAKAINAAKKRKSESAPPPVASKSASPGPVDPPPPRASSPAGRVASDPRFRQANGVRAAEMVPQEERELAPRMRAAAREVATALSQGRNITQGIRETIKSLYGLTDAQVETVVMEQEQAYRLAAA